MSGRWTKIAAAATLAVALAGCSPTAAPKKQGTAAQPLRNATSHVTRGTDHMIRGAAGPTAGTGRGGLFGWFGGFGGQHATPYSTGSRTGRMGAGMTPGTVPAPARGPTGTATGPAGAGMGVGTGMRGTTGTAPTGAVHTRRPGNLFGAAGTKGTKTPLHVVGFFTEGASLTGLKQLGRDPKALSYLAPWWYTLQADGSVKDTSTPAARAWAKSHHVPVTPLVTNGGQVAVLTNQAAMSKAISTITDLVKTNNYAGINVDFQGLHFTQRQALDAFVDELSHNLHAMGKILTVDIIPTAAQTGAHGAYDEVTLSHYADQLILMTYDRHDNTSAPGPVSPHAWVVAAVKHALQSGVPANKIILGVNSYGYNWIVGTHKGHTIPQKKAAKFPASEKKYDPKTTETKITYTKAGKSHVIYYGGRKALADKVAIARKYHLYGLAIWKVGYEDHAFWAELLKVNGDAASLQRSAGKAPAPSAAFKHKVGTGTAKPMAHRPIGTRTGTGGTGTKAGVHSGTAVSPSGKDHKVK